MGGKLPASNNARRDKVIFLASVLFSSLFVLIAFYDGLASGPRKGFSFDHIIEAGTLICLYAPIPLLFMALRRLYCREWISSLFVLGAVACLWATYPFAHFLIGDRYMFPGPSHAELATEYKKMIGAGAPTRSTPRLIPFETSCHPPNSCNCWIALDFTENSQLEKEQSSFHYPTAALLVSPPYPIDRREFGRVSVRRIKPGVFSIVNCLGEYR